MLLRRRVFAADLVKVNMGTSAPLSSIIYLPTVLADRLGYFKDEGLDLTIQQFSGGSPAAAALVNGTADTITGNYQHTIQLAAQGKTVTAFAQMTETPGLIVAVSPKTTKDIRSIEDLKGMNVGVSAPGGGTDILLKYLLKRANIPADDVPVVSIGLEATAISAMEFGKVDAAVMLDPAFSALQQRVGADKLRVLADLRQPEEVQKYFGVRDLPTAVFYATPEWLAAHGDTARKLVSALAKTLDWIRSHSAEEMFAKLPPEFAGDQSAVYIQALKENKTGIAEALRFDPAGADIVMKMMAPSKPVDISKTFTNDFVS
jgi:NitT/TauT family transport system substrate-binding protein